MSVDKVKTVEIDGRKFQVYKMSAKTSLKVTKILAAKILPFLDSFLGLDGKLPEGDNMDDFLSTISLEKIADAIDHIDEADLEKLIDYGLSHCYEQLAGGATQVLNSNGTYGVAGVEDDMIFTLRLTVEAIAWSVSGFFDASRWTSMFQGMGDIFKLNMPTSMNSTAAASFSSQ